MTSVQAAAKRAVAMIRLGVRSVLLRSRIERELDAELRFHLDQQAEEYAAQGMSQHDARMAARRKFGTVARIEEECRDEWHVNLLDRIRSDIRFGVRMLRRTPVLTAVAIGTLAVGIGATTALFGLLYTVRFGMIAAPHPEQLYAVQRVDDSEIGESVSGTLFRALESGPGTLGEVAGYAFRVGMLDGQSDSVVAQLTSDNWFAVVGVHPSLGRSWTTSGDASTIEAVAVISDALARLRFGNASRALGHTILLNGRPLVVVGVMPRGFTGVSLDYRTDVWVPLARQAEFDGASLLDDGTRNWIRVVTRLGPSRSPKVAVAAANLVIARERQARLVVADSLERLTLVPAAQPDLRGRGNIAATLILLMVLSGSVLLIACANLANLQLIRGATRRRELTIRASLGASRSRLLSQLLTENALMAIAGGAVGLALAVVIQRVVVAAAASGTSGIAAHLPGVLDAHEFTFTAALTLVVAFAFGVAPAFGATRIDVAGALKETALSIRGTVGRRGRSVLLVVQLAASVVLLSAAGMVARTLHAVQTLDLGFSPRDVVQLSFDWGSTPEAQIQASIEGIASKLRAVRGVNGVSISMPAAYGRSTASSSAYHVANDASPAPHSVELMSISPEFFATLRIPLLRGRTFNAGDRKGAPMVVVLNQAAARRFFPSQNPVGRHFDFLGLGRTTEVVGMVGETRVHNAVAAPPALVYIPLAQDPGILPGARTIEVRGLPEARSVDRVSRLVASVDPRLHVAVQPIDAALAESLALERLSALTTGAFGIAGLVLAVIGLYGLQSYFVARRTAETGLRLALGASPLQVRQLVWLHGMRPALIGAMLGVAITIAVARLFQGAVFGLSRVDLWVVAQTVVLMVAVAGVACYLPALRASRLDPAIALRAE